MGWIDKIEIISDDGMTDIQRIDSQLKALMLTVEKTIPGSRGFGLYRDFISSTNPYQVVNEIASNLEEKVETYIPEITIASVDGTPHIDGHMDLVIHIEGRE